MYGMLVTVDEEGSFTPVVRLTKASRSSSDCALMKWFAAECARHRLPVPSYHFGIRSLSL